MLDAKDDLGPGVLGPQAASTVISASAAHFGQTDRITLLMLNVLTPGLLVSILLLVNFFILLPPRIHNDPVAAILQGAGIGAANHTLDQVDLLF